MKNKLRYLLIISLMYMGISCDNWTEGVYSFKLHNNTNESVWCYYSLDYPNTTLSLKKPHYAIVNPNMYVYFDSKNKWEDVADTISIFILSNDTVDNYNWDRVRVDYNILKRYDISTSEMKSMVEIFYPPTEVMQGVKQYPPYSSE